MNLIKDLATIVALLTFVVGAMCIATAATAPLSHAHHQEN